MCTSLKNPKPHIDPMPHLQAIYPFVVHLCTILLRSDKASLRDNQSAHALVRSLKTALLTRLHKAVRGHEEESVEEGRVKGQACFGVLHRMRVVERTCLLRACVNQRLLVLRERERDRGRERVSGQGDGASQTAHGPGCCLLSFQNRCREMERNKAESPQTLMSR